MTTQHTPGPWQVAGARHSGDLKIGRDARLLAVGPDGDPVAMVFFDMQTGLGQKDARLIAAAPALLEALEQAADMLDELYPGFVSGCGAWNEKIAERDALVVDARAAIALARGAK